MKNITFVFASLNNGYDNNSEDPVPNYHFERTLFSVNSLRDQYDANVIFVDWCSAESQQYLPRLTSGITYIYVPELINNILHKNNNSKQQFYEWIAKDIGSSFVNTEQIAFVNGDNIFPKKFIDKISSLSFDSNCWYSATRKNINNSVFKDQNSIYDILNKDNPEVSIIDTCNFCSGDFTLCSKIDYENSGGYNYSHKHAYEDAYLTSAFERIGLKNVVLSDAYYHLSHRAMGSAQIFSDATIHKNDIKPIILQNCKTIIS